MVQFGTTFKQFVEKVAFVWSTVEALPSPSYLVSPTATKLKSSDKMLTPFWRDKFAAMSESKRRHPPTGNAGSMCSPAK